VGFYDELLLKRSEMRRMRLAKAEEEKLTERPNVKPAEAPKKGRKDWTPEMKEKWSARKLSQQEKMGPVGRGISRVFHPGIHKPGSKEMLVRPGMIPSYHTHEMLQHARQLISRYKLAAAGIAGGAAYMAHKHYQKKHNVRPPYETVGDERKSLSIQDLMKRYDAIRQIAIDNGIMKSVRSKATKYGMLARHHGGRAIEYAKQIPGAAKDEFQFGRMNPAARAKYRRKAMIYGKKYGRHAAVGAGVVGAGYAAHRMTRRKER
jgi:hypothetical protein